MKWVAVAVCATQPRAKGPKLRLGVDGGRG